MKYNFDEIIDRRNTNALNTDGFRGYIFHAGPEMKFALFADDEFVRIVGCGYGICDTSRNL